MKAEPAKPAEKEILTDPHAIEPSIQEQILAQMIEGLIDKPEFPPEILEQIKKLGERSQLQKTAEVSKVIKSTVGGSHATA